jgi:hypothetical protein
MPDPAPDDDDARSVLERELYWSGDPSPAGGSTSEVRIGLHDFVASMRADERSPIPRQEPLLGSQAQWKRNSKLLMYRALRPVSRRYDRLLGDLAALTRALADRLAEAEAEIEKLRTDLDERASAGGPGGSSSERARASGSPPGARDKR